MGNIRHTNNASSTLAAGITAVATSITVAAGEGALFPTLTGAQYAMLSIEDDLGNLEIVKLTARAGDVFTVVRAQEGTPGFAFSSGARIENRLTAAVLDEFVQKAGDVMVGALQLSTAEIGHASDTTLARIAAGRASIEGNEIALLGSANTWTLQQIFSVTPNFVGNARIVNTNPVLIFEETDAGADAKVWRMTAAADSLGWYTRTDADAVGATAFRVLRSGTAVTEFEINATLLDFNGDVDISGTLTVAGNAIPVVQSGTYVPTQTVVTNLTLGSGATHQYLRVGNVVTVSGLCSNANPTAAGHVEMRLSLPVASNFTSSQQCAGAGVTQDQGTGAVASPVLVIGDATNNEALLQWEAPDGDNVALWYSFTYLIV